MANLLSANVRVFPFGSERSAHPLDRVLNENNISALIRACTNDSDYVYYYDKAENPKNIGFFLHGYKFQITLNDNDSYTEDLWVYINLTTPKGSSYEFLSGNDSDSFFSGLHLVTDKSDIKADKDCTAYSLQLIAKGEITNTSPILFDRIYCGDSTILT